MARTFLLLVTAASALALAYAAWTSITSYQTPYSNAHGGLPAGEPIVERAVLIVLDGIRLDVSNEMRELQTLAGRGSAGTTRSARPSLSNPNRAVFVTGAWPEVNGVTNNGLFRPPPVDSLFSLAAEAGLPRAVAGSPFWARAFGDYLEGNLLFQNKDFRRGAGAKAIADWQADLCRDAERFLTARPTGLLVVGIPAADVVGHDFGGESEAYREVAQEVDRCLGLLVDALDNGRTAFAIVSDHGHIDRRGGGGHGGSEREVVEVPLVFAGRGIRQARGWQAKVVDIAPTLCVLLGLPLPATSQGDVLWHSLDLSGDQAKRTKGRADEQRNRFGEILKAENSGSEAGGGRVFSSATAIVVGAACLGWLLFRSRSRLVLLAGVASYFLAYHLLFMALGLGYSLSAINTEERLFFFLGKNILAAAVGLAAPWGLLRLRRPTVGGEDMFELGAVVMSVITIQVAWIHYSSGLFMDDVLPDLDLNLRAAMDLMQMGAVGVTTAAMVVRLPRGKRSCEPPRALY